MNFKNIFGPGDGNATPKASAQDRNPFDDPSKTNKDQQQQQQNQKASSPAHSRKTSLTTPTISSFKLPFWGRDSHSASQSSQQSSSSSQYSQGTDDGGRTTPGGNPAHMAAATTSLSRQEPDFTFKAQPPLGKRKKDQSKADTKSIPEQPEQPQSLEAAAATPEARRASSSDMGKPSQLSEVATADSQEAAKDPQPNNSGAGLARPQGKLSILVIEGRNLAVHAQDASPYVVAVYDSNEFVGREPITETEGPVTSYVGKSGTQTPNAPTPSSNVGGALNSSTAQSALQRSLEQHRKQQDAKNLSPSSPSTSSSAAAAPPKKPQNKASDPLWKQEVVFDVVNEGINLIQLSVLDRAHDEAFLGAIDISPKFSTTSTATDVWLNLQSRGDGQDVTGEIRIQYKYEREAAKTTLRPKDFDFLKMIGKGTFGRVFQVRKKDTKRIYAMKVLSKREIIAKKEVAHTIGERKILQRSSDCPFLLGLKFSFQSETELYLVMDYKSGGELFHHLQQEGRFSEERARFYTAEIVLAFQHLHKFDIVYRDLKPENILLDATGHIVLCDFGLSKPDLPADALTSTFCGTTEYLAPEVLLDDHGYSKLVDFWSLGVLLFEMCCGWSPFYAEDTQQMYKNICFGKIKFPRGVIGDDGKQFVKGLLNRNPRHRLGAHRDAEELKEHAFFKNIDWEALAQRKIVPSFIPCVESDESVAYFDAEFTDVDVKKEAPSSVFDDDDRSDNWVRQASELDEQQQPASSSAVPMKSRGGGNKMASSISTSDQDAFAGFSYHGGSFEDRPPSFGGPSLSSLRITPADQS